MSAKKRKFKEAVQVLEKIIDGVNDGQERARKRLELVINPRTEVLARRFAPDDIKRWKEAAKGAKMNLTDWMKMKMDA